MKPSWIIVLFILMAKMSALANTPKLSLDVGGEYGHVSNLNNATNDDLKEGSNFTAAWATIAISTVVAKKLDLFLMGSYDLVNYEKFNDLSLNAMTVEGGLLFSIKEPWLFKIFLNGGIRDYGDSDRDSVIYGMLFSLTHKTFSKFRSKVAYRYSDNNANESVYSYSSNKITFSGEWQITSQGYLTLDYSSEFREAIFYETSTPSTQPPRGRRPSRTFGTDQVAFKEDTTSNSISIFWDQSLYKGFYGQAGYSHFWAKSDLGKYTGETISVGIGHEF
ncbi:MAG: hypothetical protein HYV97_02240 [Bdellovibrio sp.]|nr:hypothetical protein [Bdellovibrio sp.]